MTPARISAIVLAAGRSSRMADAHKLVLPFRGATILGTTLDRVCQVGFMEVIVITGSNAPEVRRIAQDYPVSPVHNPRFETGMASSLAKGVESARSDSHGLMFILGDMPLVQCATYHDLCESLQDDDAIVLPTYQGERGNPVIFGRSYRSALSQLEGDVGARSILKRHPDHVQELSVQDSGIRIDIDSRDDYAKLVDK